MEAEKLIETGALDFWYEDENGNRNVALRDVNLTVREGEFIAVLGSNGSGKSTLAKHFNAILLPCGGTVTVAGIDTNDEARAFDIRRQVGMVFQNPDNQIVSAVVEEDVAFALENLGVPPAEIRKRVDRALKTVNMYAYRQHSPSQLSGGQKQRVAIAGILAMHPRCIVLDEPTAMLDPMGRREVISTIRQLNKEENITVVLITHFMDEAVQAGRVIVIDRGGVLLDGTPREVFSNVPLIKSVGLDVPQAAELIYELKKYGLDLPDGVLTEKECVQALARLLRSKKTQ